MPATNDGGGEDGYAKDAVGASGDGKGRGCQDSWGSMVGCGIADTDATSADANAAPVEAQLHTSTVRGSNLSGASANVQAEKAKGGDGDGVEQILARELSSIVGACQSCAFLI